MPAVTTLPGFALPKHCPVFDPTVLFTDIDNKDHLEDYDLDVLGIPHPTQIRFDQDFPELERSWLR